MKNTPLRIFLTDDDEGDRLLFKEILSETEIETIVHTTTNGLELMDQLNAINNVLPHLLFLDLNMPHKNGITCLKEIRNNERFKDITIAIYSTSTSQQDIDDTFKNGANIYINKPNKYSDLKKVLAKAVAVTHQNQDKSFNRDNFVLRI